MKSSSVVTKFDANERGEQVLNSVLMSEENKKKRVDTGPKISIAEARSGQVHYKADSNRETTRLLFISQDTSLLNQTTQSLDGYINLADVFDEVHIVILQTGISTRNPVLRVAPNVWMYVASAPTWFRTIYAAKKIITEQLEFAGGFRADLIVARDPFECGLLALWASKKYTRPAQLHVLSDYTNKTSLQKFVYPRIKAWLYQYSLKHFISVRTNTDVVTAKLKNKYPNIKDAATLPRFHNLKAIEITPASFNIKEKYQQFSFIILYVGDLNYESKAFQAIDAARNLMRNPKVGLVVVGDGVARAELIKRAQIIGISTQVVFEKNVDNIQSYLKSANVLIVPDIDVASDELTIKGAAAGVPLVLARTTARLDLFSEGDSALFFNDNDVLDMSTQMSRILNDLGMRTALPNAALSVIENKLHEDPISYALAYRDSVEEVLFIEDSSEAA